MTFRRRHRTAPRPRATFTGRSFIRDANGSVQPKAFTYDPKYSVYNWKRAVRWCDMTRPATSTSSTWAIAIPRLYETAYPVRDGDRHGPGPHLHDGGASSRTKTFDSERSCASAHARQPNDVLESGTRCEWLPVHGHRGRWNTLRSPPECGYLSPFRSGSRKEVPDQSAI